MADVYVSTHWYPASGREDEFVEAWRDALTWTKQEFGDDLERARLLRDEEDAGHFVSFIEWAEREPRARWYAHPTYAEHLAVLRAICSREADGSGYEEATRVG